MRSVPAPGPYLPANYPLPKDTDLTPLVRQIYNRPIGNEKPA